MKNNLEKFQNVVARLTGACDKDPLCGLDPADLFRPVEDDDISLVRNLSAAFLLTLSGPSSRLYADATKYIQSLCDHPSMSKVAVFFEEGLGFIEDEIRECSRQETGFAEDLNELCKWLNFLEGINPVDSVGKIYSLFFPEGESPLKEQEREVARLREKRKIRLTALNPHPIADPAGEILFTSNVMLTIPLPGVQAADLPLETDIKEAVESASEEDQLYWYDHPIPVGIETGRNEAVYGLRGLEEASCFEILRGNMRESDRVTCLLSVSTTHAGLREIARKYMEGEFSNAGGMEHLDIYMLTEADTRRLAEDVLIPAMERYLGQSDPQVFRDIFGVDGKYGRHYSLLKAIAGLWQILVDPKVRGTFKIDLDQVFPQEKLVEETGRSAFEHLMTPLWGAEGLDSTAESVELGMIAGALVNEDDIEKGLFSPDVLFPPITPPSTSTSTYTSADLTPDQWVFFSKLPQALSTEAEMMPKYEDGEIDGRTRCLQRVHVTGGTTGILVDSLRKYRPFTPVFIGRAEDQAYLMSVLFSNEKMNLRYVHAGGLIMRHDKEAFAGEAIEAAHLGKEVGDLARMLLFTSYARSLPWPTAGIKDLLDPFTGCFISRIPVTVVYLRLALRAASLLSTGLREDAEDGLELVRLASRNLPAMIEKTASEPEPLLTEYQREKKGWDMYYDVLDELEKALDEDDPFAVEMMERAREIISRCRLELN